MDWGNKDLVSQSQRISKGLSQTLLRRWACTLHTDASDYGIGGCLYQIVNDQNHPIMFLSKALNKTERRWSTYEKEGYAIFYSLMKMEHLLRDIHFVLRTDHKNLTFINTDFREKVKRWKLSIQHFDFDIEHIQGELNIEADWFSRILVTSNEDVLNKVTLYVIREEFPIKRPKLSLQTYEAIKKVHNSDIV